MLQKEKKQTKRNRISATALILLSVALLLTILCACGNTDRAEGSLSSADNGEPDPPSASDQLVAHAAGAVYGYRRTNSEEALDTAYWNGFLYLNWISNGPPTEKPSSSTTGTAWPGGCSAGPVS